MALAQEQTHSEAKATSQNRYAPPPPPPFHIKNDLLNIYKANASWGGSTHKIIKYMDVLVRYSVPVT